VTEESLPQLPIALLELLHPSGTARSLVLDNGGHDAERHADLVVVAPAAATDRHTPISPAAAAATASASLAEGGVVYVFASAAMRFRLLRRLSHEGLHPVAAFVHVRSPDAAELLVELDRAALNYALAMLVHPNWRLRLVTRATARVAIAAAALLAPRVGVVVHRTGDRPPAAWLAAPEERPRSALILRRSRTNGRESHFVYSVGSRRLIVKVRDGAVERRQLEQHGAAAARAGAVVATPVNLVEGPPGAAALTLLQGLPATTLLRRGRVDVGAVVERLTEWLQRWNVETAARSVVTERMLENELLAHVRLLQSTLRGGARYRAWLEQQARGWVGIDLPLVTAHLDLTMANVLLTRDGGIAVVDWVEARGSSLPLVDFFYAAVDAAAAAGASHDSVGGFRACFAGGAHSAIVRTHELSLRDALSVSKPVRDLCFHACWLHHAANEFRSRAAGPRPFTAIVELVAADACAAAAL